MDRCWCLWQFSSVSVVNWVFIHINLIQYLNLDKRRPCCLLGLQAESTESKASAALWTCSFGCFTKKRTEKNPFLIDSGPGGAAPTYTTIFYFCIKVFRSTKQSNISIEAAVSKAWTTLTSVFHFTLSTGKKKRGTKKTTFFPYLSDKSLGRGWAHEQHGSA